MFALSQIPNTAQNNYLVILFTNLGQTGAMPLLLSAVWLSTAGKHLCN
jgi:hypothetical protein